MSEQELKNYAQVKRQTHGKDTGHNTGKSKGSQVKFLTKKGKMKVRVETDLHKILDEEFRKRPEKRKHKKKVDLRREASPENV